MIWSYTISWFGEIDFTLQIFAVDWVLFDFSSEVILNFFDF